MRELPLQMNGTMVRGPMAIGKLAFRLLPRTFSHPVESRMLSPLVSRAPAIHDPAYATQNQHSNQHDPKDHVDLLATHVILVIERAKQEFQHHA